MAATFMALIESDGISGHETTHDFAQRSRSRPKKKVEMVWQKRPRVALGLSVIEYIREAVEPARHRERSGETGGESLAVLIVAEDLSPFNPPGPSEIR